MTGYKSKKAAAQAKLMQDAFDAWWDSDHNLKKINPCMKDSFEYWAWEGWHAALAQPAQEPVDDVRGFLAARLTCWHKLTEKESDELVALFESQPEKNT